MKNFKRIAAMTAALTLAACAIAPMSMTASAAGSITVKSDVNNDEGTHTYETLQIFTCKNDDGVLTDIKWGSNVDVTNLAENIAGNATLSAFFDGCNSASDYAKKLSAITETDDAITKLFAKAVADSKKGTAGGLKNLVPGYYLVQDANAPTLDTGAVNSGAYTRYIVKVVGDAEVSVNAKTSAPVVQKKVKENVKNISGPAPYETSAEKWNDVADYSIGDMVPFKLYGTMPSNLADYSAYYYKFTDTLGKEFTVDNDTEFTIKVDGKVVNANKFNIHITTTTNSDNSTTIAIEIEDIKALQTSVCNDDEAEPKVYALDDIEVTATSVITVEYEAKLNSNAVIGLDGQMNAVKLDYSNNPNVSYTPSSNSPSGSESPDTTDSPNKPEGPNTPNKPESPTTPSNKETPDDKGETPVDKVIVFTYELDINKVDSSNITTKLKDAKFIVMANDGLHKDKYVKVDANGKVSGWLDDAPTVASTEGVFVSSETDLIKIKGLDDGEYVITEIAAPAQYELDSTPRTWTISATTGNIQTWTDYENPKNDALTKIDLLESNKSINQNKTDTTNGVVEGMITNAKGGSLPSTGGMGTRLFVLGGGCAAALAGIYLISKKRVDAE